MTPRTKLTTEDTEFHREKPQRSEFVIENLCGVPPWNGARPERLSAAKKVEWVSSVVKVFGLRTGRKNSQNLLQPMPQAFQIARRLGRKRQRRLCLALDPQLLTGAGNGESLCVE